MIQTLYASPGEKPSPVATEEDISRRLQEGKGCLWVDLEDATDAERGILDRVFKLHKLAIETCIAQTDHPRIDDFGDYLYLVVHGVTARSEGVLIGGSRIQLQEIDIFLGANFLITYHSGKQGSIDPYLAPSRQRSSEVALLQTRFPGGMPSVSK